MLSERQKKICKLIANEDELKDLKILTVFVAQDDDMADKIIEMKENGKNLQEIWDMILEELPVEDADEE